MTEKKRILIGIIAVVLIVVLAFFTEKIIREKGNESGIIISVIQNDETIAFFDSGVVSELIKQGMGVNENEAAEENSLLISEVLDSAGVINYNNLVIEGSGKAKITIDGSEEIKNAAFIVNSNNTISLVDINDGNRVIMKTVCSIKIQ